MYRVRIADFKTFLSTYFNLYTRVEDNIYRAQLVKNLSSIPNLHGGKETTYEICQRKFVRVEGAYHM